MNSDLIMKGSVINDRHFADELRKIADSVSAGVLGVYDAVQLVDAASTQHAKTAAVLIETLA